MENNIRKYWDRFNSAIIVYLFLIVVLVGISIAFPIFRSSRNLSNVLVQITPLAIIAIGQTIALIGGGVDLTVGVVASLTTVLAANFMGQSPFGVFLTIIIIILAAVVIGIVNGVICNETKIPPLIVTLATGNIIRGIILSYRMSPGGSVPKGIVNFFNLKFGIFSIAIVVLILLYVLFTIIMSKTSFGVSVYAMGGNPEFARMAGINIKKVRIMTYIISALLAAVAGLVISARTGTGIPNVGDSFLMDSLTAVIIGGATFAGGQGFIIGTFGGAVIVSIIGNVLNISNVSPFYQYIAKGAVLLIAMILNSRKKKL